MADRLSTLSPGKAALVRALLEQRKLSRGPERIKSGVRPAKPPLSFSQERIWFLEKYSPFAAAYNIPIALRLTGLLDTDALERAFAEVVRRHECLRTRFPSDDERLYQLIESRDCFRLVVHDLSSRRTEDADVEARRLVDAQASKPFDLERGPLCRVCLFKLSEDQFILLMVLHHIVSDGWSVGVLKAEVAALYKAYSLGRVSPLPALPIQYADYAIWQREWLQGEVLARQLAYWKNQLSGMPPALELPTDHVRPAVQSFRGARVPFTIESRLSSALLALGRQSGATLYMVLLAAFQTLLSRWSGQRNIVVGSPIAGRTQRETEGLIGLFVNTLVLRTDLSDDPSFSNLLSRVKATALEAYAHQDVPFEKLVAELQPERDLSRQPLFQVMFALQNVPQATLDLDGIQLIPLEPGRRTAKFDLFMQFSERAEGLVGSIEYATDLFEAETIERMVSHFRTLLEGIVANPDCRVSDLPLLTKAERHQILVEWNDTAADFPQAKCVHEIFAEQATRTPDATAVVFEDQRLSYGELDRRSNQLAHHLRGLGVGPEVVVGLCVERSADLVVGLLGILKAGGAYLPLDPSYPPERLDYMVRDAKAPVIVCHSHLLDRLEASAHTLVQLDIDAELARQSEDSVPLTVCGGNAAYVIYTSGSTGKPKGVQGRHVSVTNRIFAQSAVTNYEPTDLCCQKGSVGFVDSLFELLVPLSHGLGVVIIPADVAADPERLIGELARRGVTHIVTVPSLAMAMLGPLEAGHGLDRMATWVLSGETVRPELLASLRRALPRCRFVNLYGSTEITADATIYHSRPTDSTAPIGRPLPNMQVYVLDRNFNPVPAGIDGELYLGGDGLARGYLGRPAETAERFVPNPFRNGERLFRTGDLAHWRSDGELEFVGRVDQQVKIRGYRIELGEIESALIELEQVKDAVVVAREDMQGEKRLVAYVILTDTLSAVHSEAHGAGVPREQELGAHLREALRHFLPGYMVPSVVLALDALPLSPNGKVDRIALAAVEVPDYGQYVEPTTAVSKAVASIWADILGVARVSTSANFFDLGGHSLLATRVIAQLRDMLAVDLPLRTLFEAPVLEHFAERVELARVEQSVGQHEIEEAVLDVEGLSEYEAETMLAQLMRGTEG